jgi:TonB-linked SusC/RagA family outer membrane protein
MKNPPYRPAGRAVIRRIAALVLTLLALGSLAAPAPAQDASVSGTVVHEQTLRPLSGAQVVVEGTGRGTITDARGRFLITGLTGGQVTLRVMMLGYRPATQTVQVGASDVRLALSEQAIALDEIVVTGTAGGQQRRAIGNVVSQIRAEDVVAQAPVTNVQDMLNARAPGVVIMPGSGAVGTGGRIRVRGVSSLSLAQEPLIYVDGVRVNNTQATGPINQGFSSAAISRWNDFNPEDIESIEVIKGPAAATLYGTEAANGVIQIITKKGAEGRARFNVAVKQGANWFANPEGRLWTNYNRNPTTGQIEVITMQDLFAQERERGTPIYQTGHLQEYDMNVSGGSPGLRYFLGGSAERNVGIEPNNRVSRWNSRANLSVFPTENFDAVASIGYVSGRTDLPLEAGGGGTLWSTMFANPLNLPTPRRGFHSATPEAYRYAYQDWQDMNRFTGSVQLNHRPLGWFNHRLTAGTDLTLEDNIELVERISDPAMQFFFSPGEIRGYKDVRSYRVTFNTVDYSGTANLDLTPTLRSATSFGAQFYQTQFDTVTSYGEDFPARGLRAVRAASVQRGSENYLENTTVGVFVQQQLGLSDRVFVTAAIRADDNSAFGENFDLVYYPKLSGAWVVSEEPFFQVPFVNTLRFRAAYGQSGQQPQSFAALRTFRSIPGPGDISAVTPELVGNPDLGPERGSEIEAGFDASFLDERLGFEFTYYNQRTRDAILLSDIPPSTGFSGQQFINAGEIRNTGIEILTRASLVATPRLAWDVTLSVATNENEVLDLGLPGLQFVQAGGLVQHRVGYPVGSWFERRVVDARFQPNGTLIAGSEICDDGQGGRVACAQAPFVFLGRPTPRTEGGVSSSLTLFNTVRVYGLVDFKNGYSKMDGNLRVRCVLFRRCHENWYPEQYLDDPAWLAQTQRGGAFVNGLINDASFTRFRELSASVTIPPRWVGAVGATNATLMLAGRNLYTWTGYTGLEPEASFIGGSRGGGSAQWEQNVIPQLQQFVATLSFGF